MNRRDFIKTALIAAPVAAVTARLSAPKTADSAKWEKMNDERILDTRCIDCSYITYAPFVMKYPNTGAMSGLFYDLTQKIGELADLEMNWSMETTYATYAEDLREKKCDIFAGGIWPDSKRAKVANFSDGAFYSSLGVYVRADDRRFNGYLDQLNDPQYRFATIDGEMSQIIKESDFPHAAAYGMPDSADISLLAESVATRKADVTIVERGVANLYMRHNSGSLRNLTETKPLRVFKNTWAYAYDAPRVGGILNTAIEEMIFNGYVDKVLAKYEPAPGSFYRVREPIE